MGGPETSMQDGLAGAQSGHICVGTEVWCDECAAFATIIGLQDERRYLNETIRFSSKSNAMVSVGPARPSLVAEPSPSRNA